MDHIVSETHKADDLLAADGIKTWILRWKDILETVKTPRRTLDKAYLDWNPAVSTKQKGYRKQGRRAKRWEDDINTYVFPANRDGEE